MKKLKPKKVKMNRVRTKKKSKLHFQLKQELKEMGFELQTDKAIKFCLLLYGLICAIGYVYQLYLPYIVALVMIGTLCIPYHIYHNYKNMFDKQKWRARLEYMEQMLSSFKRHPKLLEAYQDTLTVFVKEEQETDRRMAASIRRAISIIQTGEAGEERSIYRNAVKELEREYGCHRLTTMHEYMEKVEQRGGEYKQAADILMEEHALWKTNTEKLKKEQKTKLTGIFIVTSVCICICALPAFLNNLLDGYTNNVLYQMCSTMYLALVMILLIIAENKLNNWWNFDHAFVDEDRILDNYISFQNYDIKKGKKGALPFAILFYGLAIVGMVTYNYLLVVVGIGYGIYLQRFPRIRRNALRKGTIKVLEYQYPQWMMELTLLLQTENVYVSLQQSSIQAPLIIYNEVKKLTDRLENEPDSVEPYNDFFGDLKMDNIATSMRNLYSISSLGVQEENALLRLIEHNNALMNKAEQIRGEEKINIWTVYMYLPLLIGGAKIIMDTVLLCGSMIATALQYV